MSKPFPLRRGIRLCWAAYSSMVSRVGGSSSCISSRINRPADANGGGEVSMSVIGKKLRCISDHLGPDLIDQIPYARRFVRQAQQMRDGIRQRIQVIAQRREDLGQFLAQLAAVDQLAVLNL